MAEENRSTQFDELKEIVTRTLEKKGVLAKTQAQLRSHLFTALIEQEDIDNNASPPSLLADENGRITFSLIAEYLSFHRLDYTLSLLKVESRISEPTVNDKIPSSPLSNSNLFERPQLTAKLSAIIGAQSPKPTQPLLTEIVTKISQNNPFARSNADTANATNKLQFKARNSGNDDNQSSKNVKKPTKSRDTDDLSSSLNAIDFDFASLKRRTEKESPPQSTAAATVTESTKSADDSTIDISTTTASQISKNNELPPLPPLKSVNINKSSLPPLNYNPNPNNNDSDFDTIGAMLDDISLFSDNRSETKKVTFANETETAPETVNEDNSYGDDNDFGSDIVADSEELQLSPNDKSDESSNSGDNPYAAT